jgi:hypothetical protein
MIALATATTFLAGAAYAGMPEKGKKAPKLTEVKVCPISGKTAMGPGGGTEVVGKYNVHFCCPSCKPEFDKLSKADKEKKIAGVLKKQKSAPKKG